MLIPSELQTKGGPRRYEAIFVSYNEDRVGWYVRDLKRSYHFLCDVIFNESIPGHLSPVHPAVVDSKPLPSIHPVHSRVCTPAGQAFANVIHACDVALASHRSWHTAISAAPDPGGDKPLSLLTILDFVSLVTVNSFPTILIFSLDSFFFTYIYFS
jgi:hypothetical protein